MDDFISIGGPVERIDGDLVLRIPLDEGGYELVAVADRIGQVKDGYLSVVIPLWLHLHDLRREFASQLLEADGVKIHDVRDALGHSNTTMTSRYLGVQRDQKQRAYQQRTAHRARKGFKVLGPNDGA